MSKLPISWSDGTFAGKTIFPKTTTFTSYSGFEQKLSDTNRKSFGRFFKTTVYVSRGKFWGKRTFLWEISSFIIFDFWSISFCNFAAKMTAVIVKLHFSCPVELFEHLFLRFLSFFLFSGLQKESFLTFGMKTFGRVVDDERKNGLKNTFYFSHLLLTSSGSFGFDWKIFDRVVDTAF